jgi:protein involved in polysaccharide export with SLBB domain
MKILLKNFQLILIFLFVFPVKGQTILENPSGIPSQGLLLDKSTEQLLKNELGLDNNQSTNPAEQLIKAEMGMDLLDDQKEPEESIQIEKVKIVENKSESSQYYGYNFFTNKLLVNLLENLPPPDQYQLGPGDELIITMWGDTELRQKNIINREGNIYFDKIGLINLVTLEFEEAKSVLKSRFEKVYSSLKGQNSATTFIEISLGNLKLINIHFLGEVNNPGVIPIHPFSTVTTGLIQAGGVSKEGSLRDIKIIRDGKTINSIDYYQYLMDGNILNNIRLQNNDIISIPIKKSEIKIEGMITQPGIFELKKDETLGDLIYFAGGLRFNAGNKVNIKRILPIEYRTNEKNIFQNIWVVLPSDNNTKLMNGDKISIIQLIETEQKVSIQGQVKQAGEFLIFENMKISDLLELSGGIFSDEFWDTIYPFRADLIRKNIFDHSTTIIPIKLDKLKNGDQNQNLVLQNTDNLIVYPSSINKYNKVVEILGEVRNPGEYELDDNMGLTDLILRSGGFNYDAYQAGIEIIRVDPFNNKPNSLIKVEKLKVDQNLFDDYSYIDEYKLKNRDQVIVRKYPGFQYQKNINVTGQIQFPGDYALRTHNETLKSIINTAGGLTDESFVQGVKIIRNEKRVILDWLRRNKINLNIPILEGDSIYIPKNHNIVEVLGEVNSPGLIQFKKGLSVHDYINIAGQLTRDGDKKTISIYFANGESKGRWLFYFYPKVKPGSKIVVYSKPAQLPIDRTTYFSEVTAVIIQSMSLLIMADKLF